MVLWLYKLCHNFQQRQFLMNLYGKMVRSTRNSTQSTATIHMKSQRRTVTTWSSTHSGLHEDTGKLRGLPQHRGTRWPGDSRRTEAHFPICTLFRCFNFVPCLCTTEQKKILWFNKIKAKGHPKQGKVPKSNLSTAIAPSPRSPIWKECGCRMTLVWQVQVGTKGPLSGRCYLTRL